MRNNTDTEILNIISTSGYSGTNFNRPDFQRMMSDVDEGKVKTIIVKDMSRLGRDYLKVGYLTEFTFAEKDIHFIAINDNVDSENGSDNELILDSKMFSTNGLREIRAKNTRGDKE
ncbi:MAG: recombinase family protein [Bacilli bacterium]